MYGRIGSKENNMSEFTNVFFRNMTEKEFNDFSEEEIRSYAEELIKSGYRKLKITAMKASRKEYNETFPQGYHTPENYFYVIQNDKNEDVGKIFYQTHYEKKDVAFITEFVINKEHRNKGYGKSALKKIAEDAKEKGYKKMGLNVFLHNNISYPMYLKDGYKVIEEIDGNAIMEKEL